MADGNHAAGGKPKILGVPHEMTDDEAEGIAQMIQEAQHSARQQTIPSDDLAENATTTMRPEVERVVAASHVYDILRKFNRDFLYSQGRFDEYSGGLLLKWGDGYSRKHIWITVEGDNLVFQTSHERSAARRSAPTVTTAIRRICGAIRVSSTKSWRSSSAARCRKAATTSRARQGQRVR